MDKVRVRFAPSPTGFFHLGGARTALFNWLYARHTGGTFVLRIEDTDTARNTPEALEALLKGLRWLKLDWDEGPEVNGPYGPYFQSQRNDIYTQFLSQLQATGKVYEQDGALWFRVSQKEVLIQDLIRGPVYRKEPKDFVIFRANGTPVFHFVNAVDDICMKITHVIRGEEHLSNTSKHVELFQAFQATIPTFAHIPLILKTDGPGKMSKRDSGSLLEDYIQRHFLPEALSNYLCLLGWSPKNDQEILSTEEMISLFDLVGVNKNNARFDEKKLAHMNTHYVRTLSREDFIAQGISVLEQTRDLYPDSTSNVLYCNDGSKLCAGGIQEQASRHQQYLENVLLICQEKVTSFEELPAFVHYFLTEDFTIDKEALEKCKQKYDVLQRLKEALEWLNSAVTSPSCRRDLNQNSDIQENDLVEWQHYLEKSLHQFAEQKQIKIVEYIQCLRLALSGRSVGPGFYQLLAVLGKERVLGRIQKFIQKWENHAL